MDLEEHTAALVGHESRSTTIRGLAEPSHTSRQPETLVEVQPAPAPAQSPSEEEEEHFLQLEEEEEEDGLQQEQSIMEGWDEPAVISVETEEAPGPSGVLPATPRCNILHKLTPRWPGQRGQQTPPEDDQLVGLMSLCSEMLAI